MIEPLRIYQSERGVWQAEIRRDGAIKYFSLHTKDENAARAKWYRYIADIERYARPGTREEG